MTNRPCCIDIYHGDEVSDHPNLLAGLDQVKHTGIFALIHKATEGSGGRDARYDSRRAKWMSGNAINITDLDGAQLNLAPLWGGYHFFHGPDPKAEAANFLMTARFRPENMAFLDWEAVGASGFQPSLEAADAFCMAVEDALGRPIGVYGGNVPRERFEAERVSEAVLERFAARPLWFCAYGAYSEAKLKSLLPIPWHDVGTFLWQDDGDKFGPGPHTIPGIIGYCDNSTVVGSMTFAKLHEQWLGKVASQPVAVTVPSPIAATVTQPKPTPSAIQALENEAKVIEGEVKSLEARIKIEEQKS